MVKIAVIATFALSLFFNVFLNSFDVYSDVILAFNALTFNLGDSILLSGCKACSGKLDKDVFSVKNSYCQQCLTKNHNFQCGQSVEIIENVLQRPNYESFLTREF